MNPTAIAAALRALADAIEEPTAGSAPRALPSASLPPSFDDLPPMEDDYRPVAAAVQQQQQRGQAIAQQDAALGVCPVHGTPWTIKAAGVSKAGKPYSAFYKCSEKSGDAYCDQKPTKVWADTHPIRDAA